LARAKTWGWEGLDHVTTHPDIWDNFVFEVSLDQSFVSTLEDAARWAIKNRLVDGVVVPNFLDYIYFDALRGVKPEAVSILH